MALKLKLYLSADSLTPLKRNLLLILPPVGIIILFVFLLIKPSLDERKGLIEEIEKQKSEMAALEKDAAKLPQLKAENKKLEGRLVELQTRLPEEKEVSGLLKQVSELGINSGLKVIIWRPGGRNMHPSREVYEIPVEVIMRGTYHKFGQFFSNITGLSRIVNVFNINMKQSGLVQDVNFTAMTYSKISEQERKEIERMEKEKAKKKK